MEAVYGEDGPSGLVFSWLTLLHDDHKSITRSFGCHLSNALAGLEECIDDAFIEVSRIVDKTPELVQEIVPEPICTVVSKGLRSAFPEYKTKTATTALTAAQVAGYVVEYALQPRNVGWECWLSTLGGAYGPSIAHGELWRLVMPVFLHGNTNHVLMNSIIQSRMGYRIENSLGIKKYLGLYFGSAILANLISAGLDKKLSVGSSTAGFALLGCNSAGFIIRWSSLPWSHRVVCCITTGMIMSSMYYAPVFVDVAGHGVGFLVGVSYAFWVTPDDEWSSDIARIFFRGLAALAILGSLSGAAWLYVGPQSAWLWAPVVFCNT